MIKTAFSNRAVQVIAQRIVQLSSAAEFQRLRRSSFLLLLLIIYYLAFTYVEHKIQGTFNDKINHTIAFLCLAFGRHLAYPNWSRVTAMGFLLAYGFSIEIVQFFLPWREFSLLDVLADSTGIIIYEALFYSLATKWLLAFTPSSADDR